MDFYLWYIFGIFGITNIQKGQVMPIGVNKPLQDKLEKIPSGGLRAAGGLKALDGTLGGSYLA